MISSEGKLEWFGGNQDALEMFRVLVDLGHVWDDLIDRDKDVSEQDINRAFLSALVVLPSNPFYQSIQSKVCHWWWPIVSAYEAANHFEKEGSRHGLEISHMLRYSAGHIVVYASIICLGFVEAQKFMPEIWRTIVPERFEKYKKEHLKEDG